MQTTYLLTHKFNNTPNSTNYIYDCIKNTQALNQYTPPINNILHLAKITPTIQVTVNQGILNQGSLGSCGPNALAVAVSVASKSKINDLCRLYTYFNTEALEGANPLQDYGVITQVLVQSLQKYKCCPEKYFPYVSTNYLKPPPLTCYQNTYAISNVVYTYISQNSSMFVNIQNAILNTIHQIPGQITGIIVGIQVYNSFLTSAVASNGIVPMPNTKTEPLAGGHCVALIGYVTIGNSYYVVFQNSWGASWGNNGCGYLPIAYLQNPALSEKPTVISFNY